jgi:hypothetical protein
VFELERDIWGLEPAATAIGAHASIDLAFVGGSEAGSANWSEEERQAFSDETERAWRVRRQEASMRSTWG